MEINEFVSKLQEKYNYSEQLVTALKRVIPAIIEYYTKYCGEDAKNTIFNALYNCEIHIQPNGEEPVKYCNEQFNEKEEKLNTECKMPAAFWSAAPVIIDNKAYFKQFIYMKTEFGRIDLNNEETLAHLVHEMCHAIKGYNKMKYRDGNFELTTGLTTTISKYNPEKGQTDYVGQIFNGLEEGINSFSEGEIMSMILGRDFKPQGYLFLTQAVNAFFKNEETKKVIIQSGFKSDDSWIEYFGREKAERIGECFDIMVEFQYNIGYMHVPEKFNKFQNARKELVDIINNYSSLESVQKFKESRTKADQKTVENINKILVFNEQTKDFEEEEHVRKVG